MLNIQNKVAVSELKNLKEILEGLCHDIKVIRDNATSTADWFDGRTGAYNIVIDYLQARIDFLDKMA